MIVDGDNDGNLQTASPEAVGRWGTPETNNHAHEPAERDITSMGATYKTQDRANTTGISCNDGAN